MNGRRDGELLEAQIGCRDFFFNEGNRE
jgi:hypothetical protein